MYAQVIVDVAHTNVAKPFSYTVPQGLRLQAGMRVSVPLGPRQVGGYVVALQDAPPDGLPPEKLKPISRVLDSVPSLLPQLMELAREMAQASHCPLCETLRLMLPPGMRDGRTPEKKELYASLAPGAEVDQAAARMRRSPKRVSLLRLLEGGAPHRVSDLAKLVKNPRDALRALQSEGLVQLSQQPSPPAQPAPAVLTQPPPLTADQREALETMRPSLQAGQGAFLLNGVTGSGKTEVYLAMVNEALAMGRGAIILVPEIALTPQMVRWFRERFGPQTAVLHSRLTDSQRVDEWRRIRLGAARVVVGARSAVFAPVERLGLIVIDEEHESTYLSDRHPRYDARRVAASRAAREGATLVLSSATPSILSFAMARRGDYTLVEMPRRVLGHPMPHVTVVDMRRELEQGNRSLFSRALTQALSDCLARGDQAMLFLNRRGYNTFVSCRSCGYVVRCEQCDLTMTLHRERPDDPGVLRCHMCGLTQPPPKRCPECQSAYIRYFGSGTQRVEEEVRRLFPDVPTVRMDNDTTRSRDAHAKLLDRFGRGDARVLIGTQMIAKGLDFPRVTLVGVVAADMTLNLPDYRAPERTFQLITQVAGRAGRAERPGEVIVQTYKPDSPCIQAAARQDYRAFFEQEFRRRRAGLYPPFTSLARLLVESPSEAGAQAMAERLYDTVQTYLLSHPPQKRRTLMVRLDAAPVKRIRGQFRYQVLLKVFQHPDAEPLLALLSELGGVSDGATRVYCEVNPVTLM